MSYSPITFIELQENHSVKKIRQIAHYCFEAMVEIDDLTQENIDTEYSLYSFLFLEFDENSNLTKSMEKDGYYKTKSAQSYFYDNRNNKLREIRENHWQFSKSYIDKVVIYEYNFFDEIINKKTYYHRYRDNDDVQLMESDEWRGYKTLDFTNSEYYSLKEIVYFEYFDWGRCENISVYNQNDVLEEKNINFYDIDGEHLEKQGVEILKNSQVAKSLKEINAQRVFVKKNNIEFKYDTNGNIIEKVEVCRKGSFLMEKFKYDDKNNEIYQICIRDNKEEYRFVNYYDDSKLIKHLHYSDGDLFQRTEYVYDKNRNYTEKKVYTGDFLTSYHKREIEYY